MWLVLMCVLITGCHNSCTLCILIFIVLLLLWVPCRHNVQIPHTKQVHEDMNEGWLTRWHLHYYLLLNMFQTLIHPSSGACDYLLHCVGWLEACWCYVAGLSVGDVVSECRLNHWTNRQSRYITPAHLKSAYTMQQVVASFWRWTY